VPDEFVFEPEEILRVLADHGVKYVLIGGYAAVLRGSALFTTDADICPRADPENLHRLAAALRDMGARVRTDAEPEGLVFACDAEFLSHVRLLNLATRYGDFDLSFEPAGTAGYDDLRSNATAERLAGVTVVVASIADIIRSKQAADRPKDRQALPHLLALQDEIARHDQEAS
jgi:hypothetical protein